MSIQLRPGAPADAGACGVICYEAFAAISGRHAFPPDFPNPDVATGLIAYLLSRADVYSVVAESGGRVVGSNFLWEADEIVGVGPITVDPSAQDGSVGRKLMEDVLRRAAERGAPGVRLVQAGYHSRSLALYTRLGFDVREPLACMQGPALGLEIPGYPVRPATTEDLDACARLCHRVHGHARRGELSVGIELGSAAVAEHAGRVVGYTSGIGFMGHAVAESNTALQALIGAAQEFPGPGLLLPARNGELFRWCMDHGLRVVQTMNLMSLGLYNEPQGAFLPSVLY